MRKVDTALDFRPGSGLWAQIRWSDAGLSAVRSRRAPMVGRREVDTMAGTRGVRVVGQLRRHGQVGVGKVLPVTGQPGVERGDIRLLRRDGCTGDVHFIADDQMSAGVANRLTKSAVVRLQLRQRSTPDKIIQIINDLRSKDRSNNQPLETKWVNLF